MSESSMEPSMGDPYRVMIIGAGMAGLTAAAELAGGNIDGRPVEVLVVDKAKGPGGRLATRRIDDAVLDHGAQFFTVRSEAFQARVERWLADSAVEEWCRGFEHTDGYPRYRGAGGMNKLAKHLAAELTDASGPAVQLVTRQRADAIIPGPDRWAVSYHGGSRDVDEVDAIIATPPVPQVVELLKAGAAMPGGALGVRLETMTYHKVIGVLTRLDRSPALPAPGALQQPEHHTFSFVADNQAKAISPQPAMTFHLTHALSSELWDAGDDEVLARVADELTAHLGPATALEAQVKRWRYAGPVTSAAEASLQLADRPGPLFLAGDGFAGAKVEGAFLSGLDAATQLLAGASELVP